MTIRNNLENIKQQIGTAKLVAVTKYATDEQIAELIATGHKILGESRIQVAKEKYTKYPDVEWHLIGHLQTNKAKDAVKIFELIQSVDSLKIAKAIDQEAIKINKKQNILLQVNIGEEPQKYGFKKEEVSNAITEISQLKNISIRGLMAMAPYTDDPEKARPYFREMKKLFDANFPGGAILSLGMSGDYQVALQEGATMVRIGTALFAGARGGT